MLLIGNLLSLLGCLLMVAVGLVKKKERVLYIQCIQFTLMGAGNLVLGAVSGLVANGVSILRNLVFAKTEGTLTLKLVFIAIQVVMTLWTGAAAPIEWLPVLAAVIFTWCLDLKSAVKFKLCIIACQILWTVYDWYYHNYVAFTFDLLTIASNLAGIWLLLKTPTPEE